MEPALQKTMKAILLKEINGPLSVETVPIPKPEPGQVLIKMEASPIHPADFSFLKGQYGMTKPLPVIPGNEGCGVVIQNGGGLLGWKLTGQKVAVAATAKSTGTWAEYMVAEASRCIPMNKETTFEEGAFAIGNPMTALAFYDIAVTEKAKGVILSAACSAVGRMSSRYLEFKGLYVINIVRRKEQEEILKGDGVKYILNSNDVNFEENLKEMIKKLNPTCFFDSVGGFLTGVVLKNMPAKSTCYMYGFLAKEKCEVDGRDLRYKEKTLKGFWLMNWIKEKGSIRMLFLLNELKNQLKSTLKTSISKVVSIEEINEGINYYKHHMSDGKILIRFSKKEGLDVKEEEKKGEFEENKEKSSEKQEKKEENIEINQKKEENKEEIAKKEKIIN